MWQLNNTTPYAANVALFPDEDAVDTLYVIVKATFSLGEKIEPIEKQIKPLEADSYWGEPGESSIRYASDMHTGKAATDIIVLGHACAPEQKEVTELDVSVAVGTVSKTIRVFGDRQWQDGKITAPVPFKTLAMVYENAFGGTHLVDGKIDSAELRNPVGKGFAGKRKIEDMNGVALPNLEDPSCLIRAYNDNPAPACFGFAAPNWHPRTGHAGTFDGDWKKNRAPYLPKNFDKRFLNMAHADLVYPGFLKGGEGVRVTNMSSVGDIRFQAPRIQLAAQIEVGAKRAQPAFELETLILETDSMNLTLIWRAAMPCDKKAFTIGDVKITHWLDRPNSNEK